MKIAVIAPSAAGLELIGRYLQNDPAAPSITLTEGGMGMLSSVTDQHEPDLVIIAGTSKELDKGLPLEYVAMQHPQTMILMLCSDPTPEFLVNAMRFGVREVLPYPVEGIDLRDALVRAELKRRMAIKPRRNGTTLALIACKGGSGATFLATNLAFQLSAGAANVLLIDCNLQFGDAVLFAHDRKPSTNLADLARDIHRLDASFLAASVVQVTPSFAILAAPDDPGQAMAVKPEHIEQLLNLAVGIYDYVLVDVGRVLDPVTLKVLDKADIIYPVLQMTLPFIRDASRLLAVFRSLGYSSEKIRLLVNRFEKGGDVSLADLERTLGVKNLRTIPNSYKAVASAVNQGVPLAQIAKGNPVTRSIEELVLSFMPPVETTGNWLGRWLKTA